MRLRWILLLAAGCAPAAPPPAAIAPAPPAPLASPAPPAPPRTTRCPEPVTRTSVGPDAVAHVEVRGLLDLRLETVCRVLRARAGRPLGERDLQHDVGELLDSGLIDDVTVSSEASPAGRTIVFRVHERAKVRRWSMKGVRALDPAHARTLLDLDGNLFYPHVLQEKAARLRQEYLARGYTSAEVRFRVEDAPGNQVDVTFEVEEGPGPPAEARPGSPP